MAKRRGRRKRKSMVPRNRFSDGLGKVTGASMQGRILPERLLTKFTYVSGQQLATGVGQLGLQHNFVNSCFDPDSTGTGHQPPGYDTLLNSGSGPYTRCRVYAVKVKATCYPVAGTPNLVCYLGENNAGAIVFNPTDHDLTNRSDMITKPMVRNSTRPVVLQKYFDLRKLIGPAVMNDDIYRHNWDANPTQLHYFIFGAYATNQTSTDWNIDVNFELTYYCILDRQGDEDFDED